MDSVGEGESGMIWENGIETCVILPVPAGKVDQVPRTCTARLRKKTTAKEFYNKDGVERFRHVSTKGCSLTMTLFSILYLYRRA